MSYKIYNLKNKKEWDSILSKFDNLDFYYFSNYHDLYSLRYDGSVPCLWVYEKSEKTFVYPFNLTEILLKIDDHQKFFDISSTYGFVGPYSNSNDENFINDAWNNFDEWCLKKNIILEFIRFNPLLNNEKISHKNTKIEFNRDICISDLSKGLQYFENKIPSKTKNMIRKAVKNNFLVKKKKFKDIKDEFIKIYNQTMIRNNANKFFIYDQKYFDKIDQISNKKFYGVFIKDELIAGGIFFLNQNNALYHLGASKKEYQQYGLSNLYMHEASIDMLEQGVKYINLGGGRSQDKSDGLFRFKKNNSTDLKKFNIGKRIINDEIYSILIHKFKNLKQNNDKFIFYR